MSPSPLHDSPSAPAPVHATCAGSGPLVRCQDLVVGYGSALLPPINVTILHGELWAVVGRNGAGKTTWFKTLLGLLPPVSGRLEACSERLPKAYIPQRMRLDPIVPLRAGDVVAMGLERRRSFLVPAVGPAARRRVAWALEQMGAAGLGPTPFSALSEGQKQRVLMARLLCSGPELAVLDEPTAAMDEVAERETMTLIHRLSREFGLTVLIVTHHLPVVSGFADRVIFLDRDAQEVVAGSPGEVFEHPVFVARYGKGLMRDADAS